MPDIPLDSLGLWELARKNSDLCESLSGNRKPKTSRPKNSNDRTIACIFGQSSWYLFLVKVAKLLLLSRERATLLPSINP